MRKAKRELPDPPAYRGLLGPQALPGLWAPLGASDLPGQLVNVVIPGPQGPQVRAVRMDHLGRPGRRDLKAMLALVGQPAPKA